LPLRRRFIIGAIESQPGRLAQDSMSAGNWDPTVTDEHVYRFYQMASAYAPGRSPECFEAVFAFKRSILDG
jgi:hypothetical protein